MKVKVITMGVKRDVRHRPYEVSHCKCTLEAVLEEHDDLEAAYKELHGDALIIVEEMINEERAIYKERITKAREKK